MENKRDWSVHPPYLSPGYKSTVLRAPSKPLISIKHTLSERGGPVFGMDSIGALDNDLTKNGIKNAEPLGERIVVAGRVIDELGQPLRNTLVEVWQANAAGRYIHKVDQHAAPIDPNFLGGGRCLTDDEGYYKFYTIKPGAYPWGNHQCLATQSHPLSLFGRNITNRSGYPDVFPRRSPLQFDPIYLRVPEKSRELLISKFTLDLTEPDFALGYQFDIVLRGHNETPFENR